MSVSTSHNVQPFQPTWFSVESPLDWAPQTSTPLLFSESKYSHSFINPVNDSPTNEWIKLPNNSGCNWNDFVPHIPIPSTSAGINAESLSYSGSNSPAYNSPSSFWDNSSPDKEDSPDDFPRIQRNIDIEAELSRQNLYKTELCRSWVESASCKYGSKCQFAHGQHELRPVIRHPKYKTEICKTFHTNGTCPYGRRCRFVHNPAELRNGTNDTMQSLPDEEEEEFRQVQEQFKLANLAPDPVFTESFPLHDASSTDSKKGSSLPFFQKLRKQKPF
jgi:butyrate response factor 1